MVFRPGIRLVVMLFTVGVVHSCVARCGVSYAEDDQELAAKLKQIRSEVESAESEISRMKEEFTALLAKRTQLEESVRRIKLSRERCLSSRSGPLFWPPTWQRQRRER